VNLYGDVIGINTLIRGLHTGIGFAVPSNLAREVADHLISEGKFSRAWLGVSIRSLRDDEETREDANEANGVLVINLLPNGPATRSDLRRGDIITAVDSKSVTTETQLRNEIRGKSPGSSVTLDVLRNKKAIKVKVRPELWPEHKEAE
jgi:S1-C subfamily serine protease